MCLNPLRHPEPNRSTLPVLPVTTQAIINISPARVIKNIIYNSNKLIPPASDLPKVEFKQITRIVTFFKNDVSIICSSRQKYGCVCVPKKTFLH